MDDETSDFVFEGSVIVALLVLLVVMFFWADIEPEPVILDDTCCECPVVKRVDRLRRYDPRQDWPGWGDRDWPPQRSER